MPLGNVFNAEILNLYFNGVSVTPPAAFYAALFITEPTPSNTGREVSGGGYARAAVSDFTSAALVSGKYTVSNTAKVTFPQATSAWTGTGEKINYYAIFDASTGGRLIGYGGVLNPFEVLLGGQPEFAIGAITITHE